MQNITANSPLEEKAQWVHVNFNPHIAALLNHITDTCLLLDEDFLPESTHTGTSKKALQEIAQIFESVIAENARLLIISPQVFAGIFFHDYFYPLTKIALRSFVLKNNIDPSLKNTLASTFEL